MLKDHLYHPFELIFCGFSGSGKTTLVTRLIEKLSHDFRVGYIKHDAHNFSMDREGKDTFKATQAGASQVSIINDGTHQYDWANLGYKSKNRSSIIFSNLENDFVLIEGYKKSAFPKIVVLDQCVPGSDESDFEIVRKIKAGEITNIVAIIGDNVNRSEFMGSPYFHRDDIFNVEAFVRKYFIKLLQAQPLYGLVLTGGKSQRMQQDKGSMVYFEKSQTEHAFDLLQNYCEKVFVSCRQEQSALSHLQQLPQIHDQFLGAGPTSGILSALKSVPNARWLVLACDLPYVNNEILRYLVENENPYKTATCFLNPEKKWPEPLCAIYQPKAYAQLLNFMAMGLTCPRKVLFNVETCTLNLPDSFQDILTNVNTPDQAMKVKKELTKESVEDRCN